MRRREFIALLGGAAAAWPVAARAQQGKVWQVGFLRYATPNAAHLEAFRHGLRDLGYTEGLNLIIEERYASGVYDRLGDEEWLRVALAALVGYVRRGGAKRLAVERFDGEPVVETMVMPLLVEAGFLAGPRRAVLRA